MAHPLSRRILRIRHHAFPWSRGDASSEYAGLVRSDGPIAYWRLGEQVGTIAFDETDKNPGTYVAGPTLGVTGAIARDTDTAVTFDGATQFVSVVSSSPFQFAGVKPFTVECWFKHVADATFQRVVSCEDGATGQGWQLYSQSGAYGFVRTGASAQEIASAAGATSAWHHFVGTYDGTNMRAYFDGVPMVGSPLASAASLPSSSTFRIAAHSADVAFFGGTEDEVAIYDFALSGRRIAQHYDAALASLYAETILQDHPTFYSRMAQPASRGEAIDQIGGLVTSFVSGESYHVASPITTDATDYAMSLSGTASSIRWLGNAAFDLDDVFSIEFWMKRAAIGVDQVLIDKGSTGGTAYTVRVSASDLIDFDASGGATIASSTATIADTNWHHVVVTKSGAATLIFIDGIEGHTDGTPATLANSTDEFVVGSLASGGSPFAGSVDEVAVYKRALAAGEILTHYVIALAPVSLIIRSLAEAVASSDAWARALTLARAQAESATQADGWTRVLSLPRSLASAVAQADGWSRVVTFASALVEGVTSGDSWARVGTFLRALPGAVTSSDAWTRATTTPRTLAEAVTSSDAWARIVASARSLTGAVTSADAWTRALTAGRALAESVTHADTWTRVVVLARTLAEAVTQSDAWTWVKFVARSLTESVTSSDAWTRTGTYLRALAESVASADAWARLVTLPRALASAVASSDAWTRLATLPRTLTEAITSSDSWARGVVFARSLTAAVAQSDAWARAVTLARTLLEGVTSADAWTRIVTNIRTLTGAVTSADAWVRIATFPRSLTSAVTHGDAWLRAVASARSFASSVTHSDVLDKLAAITGAFASSVTSSDAWTRSVAFTRTLAEAVAHADALTRLGTFLRSLASATTQSDAWAGTRARLGSFASSVTQSDAWTRGVGFTRSLAFGVVSSDSWTRLGMFARSLASGATSADAWTRTISALVSGVLGPLGRAANAVASATGYYPTPQGVATVPEPSDEADAADTRASGAASDPRPDGTGSA